LLRLARVLVKKECLEVDPIYCKKC